MVIIGNLGACRIINKFNILYCTEIVIDQHTVIAFLCQIGNSFVSTLQRVPEALCISRVLSGVSLFQRKSMTVAVKHSARCEYRLRAYAFPIKNNVVTRKVSVSIGASYECLQFFRGCYRRADYIFLSLRLGRRLNVDSHVCVGESNVFSNVLIVAGSDNCGKRNACRNCQDQRNDAYYRDNSFSRCHITPPLPSGRQ